MNPINLSKSKKSKKLDVREWFSRFFRVFFRKPDKYDRNCPLLWKTPADRKSFEIIKTLAIRRLRSTVNSIGTDGRFALRLKNEADLFIENSNAEFSIRIPAYVKESAFRKRIGIIM